jgi:hypothetical protein
MRVRQVSTVPSALKALVEQAGLMLVRVRPDLIVVRSMMRWRLSSLVRSMMRLAKKQLLSRISAVLPTQIPVGRTNGGPAGLQSRAAAEDPVSAVEATQTTGTFDAIILGG